MSPRQSIAHLARMIALGLASALALPAAALAHCDSLDGPVVTAARVALQKGDVTPVLKWVQPADEDAIRAAFAKTLAVRKLSAEAASLSDPYFFETLVRIHRAGEGEPYTGMKPAGSAEPGIVMADAALAKGSVDPLIENINRDIGAAIRERFARALAAQKRAGESVAEGREYVEAYVTFIHYVEAIHEAAQGAAPSHDDSGAGSRPAHSGD